MRIVKCYACGALLLSIGLASAALAATFPPGSQGPTLPPSSIPRIDTRPLPPPSHCAITAITPNSGPAGTVVTVIGNGMNQNCQVEFSGTGRQIAQVEGMPTATQIRVYVPVVSGPGGQATVTAFKAGMQPDRTKSVAFTFTGEDCAVTASTPNTATWNEAFTLTGTRLDQNCIVDFKPDVGNPVPLQPSFQNAGQIKAQLPLYTPLGHGRVRIYPRGTSGPPAGGTSLDFMVKSPRPDAGPCETFLAQPQSGNPGTEVILWGNSIMNQGCTVEFIHLPQFGGDLPATYPAQPQGLDANHLKVKVPMMPAGTAVVVSRAGQTNTAKVNAGFTVNEVAPVLNSVAPTSGYRGDNVALSGLAFLPPVAGQEYVHAQHEDLRVVLQVGSKKFEVVPTHANNPLTAGDDLVVKLPDIFAGMTNVPTAGVLGSISVYRRVPSLSSSAVPFTFKPATGQAASTQATPASPNNAGAAKPGYRYVGTPACPSIFGKILVPNVDASGYYCCAQESAVRGGRCGDFWQEYQATCATIANCPTAGAGGGCNVNLFREGCYKPQ